MTRHLPEQARREQILSAARRRFIENGYHPTRMDEIAQAAGLSKGGVYFHFGSKREVFDTLVEEEYARSMGFLEAIAAGDAPIEEKLGQLARHYLDYFGQAPDAPRFFVVMGEMALRDGRLADRLREMQGAYMRAIARLLDQGATEGVLRPVDPLVMAAILKALVDGVEGQLAIGIPLDPATHLAAGFDLVMNGLARR